MNKKLFIVIMSLIITGSFFMFAGRGFEVVFGINNKVDSRLFNENTINLEKFDNIDISSGLGNIIIEHGENYSLFYKLNPNEKIIKSEVDGDTFYFNTEYRFTNYFRPRKNYDYKIVITVPKSVKLDKINIKNSIGDINMSKIPADEYYIDTSLGNIILKDVEANKVNVTASTGDIDISDISADEYYINNSLGDISLKNAKADNVTISASAGEITATNANIKNINASNDMGDIKLEGNFENADLKLSTGDCEISGTVKNKAEIHNSMGDINIDLPDPKIDASVSMGDIYYKNKYSGKHLKTDNGSFTLEIKSSMGDINIR